MRLCALEYEWLTGWTGPRGAAYNQVYEFLQERGIINRAGVVTPYGLQKIKEYQDAL